MYRHFLTFFFYMFIVKVKITNSKKQQKCLKKNQIFPGLRIWRIGSLHDYNGFFYLY